MATRFGFHVVVLDRGPPAASCRSIPVKDQFGVIEAASWSRAVSQYVGILAGRADVAGSISMQPADLSFNRGTSRWKTRKQSRVLAIEALDTAPGLRCWQRHSTSSPSIFGSGPFIGSSMKSPTRTRRTRRRSHRPCDFFRPKLELYVVDEEADLFPLLRRRAEPEDEIEKVIQRLCREHTDNKREADQIIAGLSHVLSADFKPDLRSRFQRSAQALAASERRHQFSRTPLCCLWRAYGLPRVTWTTWANEWRHRGFKRRISALTRLSAREATEMRGIEGRSMVWAGLWLLTTVSVAMADEPVGPQLTPKLRDLCFAGMASVLLCQPGHPGETRVPAIMRSRAAQQIHDSFILQQSLTEQDRKDLMATLPSSLSRSTAASTKRRRNSPPPARAEVVEQGDDRLQPDGRSVRRLSSSLRDRSLRAWRRNDH
ncbi:MAG: hypothetical protein R3F54_31030 [Alphaproteobacteria bacterium]